MAQRVNLRDPKLPAFTAHCQLLPLINAILENKKIVIIGGAGMSASAGIPTFESMPRGSKEMFHINMYNNPESTKTLNKELCNLYRKIEAASPTQWHLVMERIAKEKRLQRLYTQNIDGIDTDLELLKTMIPLPKKDWPKTIQLHGNLRTVRCQADDRHLIPFDPADFPGNSASRGLPCCTECEKNKQLKAIPVMRPRIWLYDDRDYPDRDAIESVKVADLRAKPDAVIVVGTALKVKYAKNLARDMCGAVRKGGFTAWINRKAPPSDLNCFDLVVEGDCDAVAWHASSWWLEEGILSKFQVQRLEEKCNLFIAKSPEEALERSLVLVDSDFRAKALQRYQSTPRGVKFKESGKTATVLAESSQRPGSSASKVVNHNVETVSKPREIPLPTWISVPSDSSDALPKLPDCWEREMSQRLSEVEVRQIESSRKSTSVVTKIPSLGYREVNIANSLWHLKPGEELNDEVVNAYLELLQRSTVSVDQAIEGTGILYLKPGRQWKTFDKLSKVRTYSIFIPIHIPGHWCFAVLTPGENNILCLEYYDSASGGPPQALRDWIHGRFPDREVEITQGSPNPRQRNGVDCGLFVLLGIRLLSASRRHLSQAQSDSIIPTFRQRVLAELLAGSLNPSSSQFEEFQRMEAHAHTILPRLEKAGDEDHQVGSPDSSVLFMSPPPVPDPMEYAETNSSAVLDESEEELVQVKPSKQKTSRGKSPVQIASTFADEASIVKMLREAISIERTLHKGSKNTKIESMQLSDLWCMISTEKRALKQRHIHYEFSRQFWAEMGNFNRSPHQRGPVPELAIFTVMSKLGICNRISWNYILQRARRASIWTELAEIFKDDVEHPSVVLCAIPEATTALETMTMANRKELIEKIHSRRNEPGNGILARLKAAADLYRAVILGDLPKDLPIESADNGLPFEQVVSSKSKTEALAQTTPFPTSISNSSESGAAHRLTPDRLRDYDDYATDILIDNLCPTLPVRKNREAYSPIIENPRAILDIIKHTVIGQRDSAKAVLLLRELPSLRSFLNTLTSEEKEDFQSHLRLYLNLYLPDCPFEVWRTTRYTSQPEAAIRARVAIEKGSEITYLSGTQARFDNEAPDNNDFSITESNRHGSIFRKLGPSRFVNHGCEPNAILGFSNSYNEVKVRALKKIWAGDEITISYGKNPFGEDNRDCHCQTCKPQPKNAQSIFSPIQLRSLREEIPLDDFKLVLLQNMHRDLYGLAWPNRE